MRKEKKWPQVLLSSIPGQLCFYIPGVFIHAWRLVKVVSWLVATECLGDLVPAQRSAEAVKRAS